MHQETELRSLLSEWWEFCCNCGCQGLFELLISFSLLISKRVAVWHVSCLFSIMINSCFFLKVLDLIVLLLIHSTNSKNRKQTEKVLRSKIRLGCMPEQLVQNAFQNHSMVSADCVLGLSLLHPSNVLSDDDLTLCCIMYSSQFLGHYSVSQGISPLS